MPEFIGAVVIFLIMVVAGFMIVTVVTDIADESNDTLPPVTTSSIRPSRRPVVQLWDAKTYCPLYLMALDGMAEPEAVQYIITAMNGPPRPATTATVRRLIARDC